MSGRRIANESDFLQLVTFGQTTESRTLDFKYDLNHFVAARPDDAKELCRDISQFANGEGGTLLVGIIEQKSSDARVAAGVHPVEDLDRRREWIEQAVQKHFVPATTPLYIDRVMLGAGPIVAINVPASERVVLVWDKALHTMECYRRTNHGKESLNPNEVLALMMNSARSSRLSLLRVYAYVSDRNKRLKLPEVVEVDVASGGWAHSEVAQGSSQDAWSRVDAAASLMGIEEFDFILRIGASAGKPELVRIPYGLLRKAWVTMDRKMALFLHVRLVRHGTRVTLEPF